MSVVELVRDVVSVEDLQSRDAIQRPHDLAAELVVRWVDTSVRAAAYNPPASSGR